MNRRSFLKSALGFAAALAAPLAAAQPPIGWRMFTKAVVLNEDWVCIVHPSVEAQFRQIDAEGRWKDAYRDWRKAGKPAPDTPQSIMDRYAYKPWPITGEIGRIDGFRFIYG